MVEVFEVIIIAMVTAVVTFTVEQPLRVLAM